MDISTRAPQAQQAPDPFGLPINPADLLDWPPADPCELARLDQWASDMEREMAERHGNGPAD